MSAAPGPDGMYAGWIETAQGPLFACYHPAQGTSQRDVAVLLCDPIGSDRMNLHLAYRALAIELAASGFPVLRVDYRGTCDSAGYPRDAGQVEAWLQSLHDGADWLLRRSGRRELGCFGALLGGTIATVFAARRSDVRSLALWGAPLGGNAYLREMRAFAALRGEPSAAPRPVDWREGDREAIGFLMTGETVAAIAALEVDAGRCRTVREAAVFARSRDGTEAPVVAAFEAAGIAVTGPPDVVVEIAELEDERVRPPEALTLQLADWWKRTHPASANARRDSESPALAARVVLRNRRGCEVQEEWVRFGPDDGVVGIVTRPIGAPRGTGVVLVNGGVNHRPGINRNYTEWARDWAEHGITVLRMDTRNLGDGVPARPEDVARVYREETRHDVEAAVALLADRYGARTLVCGGLCAGGSQAFIAALHDARIAAVFLLNPLRFDTQSGTAPRTRSDLEYESLAHYARSVLRPGWWRRVRARDEDPLAIARSVIKRLARRARARVQSLAARARGGTPPPATQLAARFLRLADRGCRALIVFDTAEAMRQRLDEELALDRARLEASGCFRVQPIHHADHIFLPLASQQEVGTLLERWLLEVGRQ